MAWPTLSPALIRWIPELGDRLPRFPFVPTATPVARFPVSGAPSDRLFVKNDEHSGPLYGGNKPRKLEWLIGAALQRGARRLVTTGAIGTHHGLATTILGRAAGLATTLVLVDQPVTDEVVESLMLHTAHGAEQVYGRNVAGAAAQVVRVLARSSLRGERPVLIATGGSSPVGCLGFVSAGLELAEQVRAGLLPEPEAVYLPVGSGGTAAGLVLGLKLAGLRSRVRGVLVTDILPPSPRRLARMARATLRLLRRASARVGAPRIEASDFEMIESQLGPGYGAPTPAARAALLAAAETGVRLETTYSAKCLAALLASAADGTLEDGPVVFWNTFNGVDVLASAPEPLDPAAVPGPFQRFLRERSAP